MSKNFYNKIAKKFGGYAFGHSDVDHYSEYPDEDPEQVFREELLQLANKKTKALDVGCGDGKFAFEIANHFSHITGIDSSKGLLKIAREKKKELNITNVDFQEQDANQTSFDDESFDLAFSRRGPTPFEEIARILKPGGYFIYIGIGEKDCQAIKEIFGHGQGFEKWNNSVLKRDTKTLEKLNFEVTFSYDYFYNEYYSDYDSLDRFLQGVPIFEDFDSEKDRQLLEKYVSKFTTDKGINLPRHRVVVVAQKK